MRHYTDEQYLKMISQDAIKQCFIDEPGYNAAWDYHVTPQNRHFIACCAEGRFPEFAKLYEYIPETNEMRLCFELENKIITYSRRIRPSKFHTSINSLPDGRLIMCTHTTASAPTHPCWMPEAYYTHMWEGFMGSNVIIYDPETGKVEDLGIPVPGDSIYSAKYIAQHDCLIFFTYLRGHIYRLDLKDRRITDYGQCLEYGVCYMKEASDGNIYFTTRSGALWRFCVETLQPEYTGIDVPTDKDKIRVQGKVNCVNNRNVMNYAVQGIDGRLYFAMHVGNHFYAYDPKTNQLETLGYTLPEELRERIPNALVAGMVFDKYGKLWYCCGIDYLTLRLCRLDIMNPEAEPEDFGILGTPKRAQNMIQEMYIINDVLYMSDTNHGADTPGIAIVDLAKLRQAGKETGILCQDVLMFFDAQTRQPVYETLYQGNLLEDGHDFLCFLEQCAEDEAVLRDNPFRFGKGKRYVCKLWKKFGIKGSQVYSVAYDEEDNVLAYIEADGGMCVSVRDGEILDFGHEHAVSNHDDIKNLFSRYNLPAHVGRNYLATATASADFEDGSVLVGTKDGMLAVIKGESVFSLGSVCDGGAVHALAVSSEKQKAYGVAGDEDGIGVVFSYDHKNGVRLEGYLRFEDGAGRESVGVSSEPCCIAISSDGKRAAIGVRDQLGCVYEFELLDE